MLQRALLARAAGPGRGAVDLAAVGTWLAALQRSASDVVALASAHRMGARGFQSVAGQNALGTGDNDAWGTIPPDGSQRTVQDYNTLISLMARRRRCPSPLLPRRHIQVFGQQFISVSCVLLVSSAPRSSARLLFAQSSGLPPILFTTASPLVSDPLMGRAM